MSTAKNLMFEKQERQLEIRLSKKLGISLGALNQLDYYFDTDEGHDGCIYSYILTIASSSPRTIVNKINGIEDGRYVYLEPSFFDTDENPIYN